MILTPYALQLMKVLPATCSRLLFDWLEGLGEYCHWSSSEALYTTPPRERRLSTVLPHHRGEAMTAWSNRQVSDDKDMTTTR